jgi:pyruvate/2-oxoacid:ferredoxin oxidoreductase beta subunit/Pyruvate/2-oxoacid:ferredoxin oxidoreductase gamma subunit
MTNNILTNNKMPFCPGCGHSVSVKNIASALKEMQVDPLDVVLVSDIGCCGLVDPLFATHSVHGLHGRAPALAFGIAQGLQDEQKKVMVIQGDGGATIGLQHIMEAARRNANMTLIVFNNQLYGMTGGQMSGLSTIEFKEQKHFDDPVPPFDIVKLAHDAGAVYSRRVSNPKEFKEALQASFSAMGFSLLEISSLCPSHGIKKMDALKAMSETDDIQINERPHLVHEFLDKPSLINENSGTSARFETRINDRVGIVLAGSAGGAIQSAAKLLAGAGILSGLHVSMKGEYPITVGTGFSLAEVILSREPIHFTGLEKPDVFMIVSEDGLKACQSRMHPEATYIVDVSIKGKLEWPVHFDDFVKTNGKRGAALSAVSWWIDNYKKLEMDALIEMAKSHKHAEPLLKVIDNMIGIKV